MNRKFKGLSWLATLMSLNTAMLVLNLYAASKIYLYQPARPSLLEIMLNKQPEPQLIDYKDFVSIMLSGLSAMITALGIGLATIAIWGYAQIKEEAKQAAERVAREQTTNEYLRLRQEGRSVEEARSGLEGLENVRPDMMQNLVDALTQENENGTNGAPRRPA